ncbi:hypothetical protein [Phenylobacterium sp.]|nr:hypothetical protein [Phenylobacterium sp.]MDP3658584.1 hypothetical protein [Phenylobacterium sp.]
MTADPTPPPEDAPPPRRTITLWPMAFGLAAGVALAFVFAKLF